MFSEDELNDLNGIGTARHGFIFPFSLNALLDAMIEEEEGVTLSAIRTYVRTGKKVELFQYALAPIALEQFVEVYRKDATAYLNKVRTNRENGSRGGRAPRKNQ